MSTNLVARVAAVILAVNGLALGLYIQISPRGFYDDFPLGARWVAVDGPFNEHVLRDFGAMNLALGVLALCAAVWLTRPVTVATGLAWLTFSVLHLGYHVLNLDPYDDTDSIGLIASLAVVPVVALLLLLTALREERAPVAT